MEWVIVIVANDEDRRAGLAERLVREGFRVQSFSREDQAQAFILTHGPRISGLVTETPHDAGDHFRICKNMREQNSRARIVVLTHDHRMIEEATRAGFFAFLSNGPLTLLVDVLRGGAPAR